MALATAPRPQPAHGERASAGHDRAWSALLAAWALGLCGWLLGSGARVTREDGFYYFQIARNVAAGLGSTFDGVHATNGYHPLWLAVLVPLFRAVPATDPGLAAAVALQSLLFAAGAVLLYRLLRRHAGPAASVLGVAAWIGLAYRESVGGLEFALHGVCLLAAMVLWDGWSAGALERRRAGALGAALCACVLVRLDNAVLVALAGAACAWRQRRAGGSWRAVAAVAAPPVLALLAYAAWSGWAFGAPSPVSGAVKREWSQYLLLHDPAYARGGLALAKLHQLVWPFTALPLRYPLVLAVGGYGAAAALAARVPALRALLPFAAWSAVQVALAAVWFHGEVSFLGAPWYFAVQPVMAVLLLAAAAERLAAVRPRLAPLAWAAAAAVAAATAVEAARWHRRDPERVTYDAAEWVRAHVPADAVLASWHAGALGYLSGRRVLNLDGLVNSWDFHRRRRADLCAYWREENVAYVVDMFEGTRPAVYDPVLASFAACRERLQPAWTSARALGAWRVAAFRLQ
jgi:hypothetical protein